MEKKRTESTFPNNEENIKKHIKIKMIAYFLKNFYEILNEIDKPIDLVLKEVKKNPVDTKKETSVAILKQVKEFNDEGEKIVVIPDSFEKFFTNSNCLQIKNKKGLLESSPPSVILTSQDLNYISATIVKHIFSLIEEN